MGAHYVGFFRNVESDLDYDPTLLTEDYQSPFKVNKWSLYDDDIVKDFFKWYDVVKACIEGLMKPTTLFYQKVHEDVDKRRKSRFSSLTDDTITITGVELQLLELEARKQTLEMRRLMNPAD